MSDQELATVSRIEMTGV